MSKIVCRMEGGGHNEAGKEGIAMFNWATENLKILAKTIPLFKE